MLLLDIIKYICLKQGTNIEKKDITILVNSDSQTNVQNIIDECGICGSNGDLIKLSCFPTHIICYNCLYVKS